MPEEQQKQPEEEKKDVYAIYCGDMNAANSNKFVQNLTGASASGKIKTLHILWQSWGGKLNDEHAAKTLGILRSEDAEAGRWALTFNDPHVLAEINTVFVTAESKKNVEHPDGKPILFAFLGTKANHP